LQNREPGDIAAGPRQACYVPKPTGSAWVANTIGIVLGASLAAATSSSHRRLLRASRQRPRNRRAAEQRADQVFRLVMAINDGLGGGSVSVSVPSSTI